MREVSYSLYLKERLSIRSLKKFIACDTGSSSDILVQNESADSFQGAIQAR